MKIIAPQLPSGLYGADSAYLPYSPTATQGGAITSFSASQCFYKQLGKMIHAYGKLTVNNPGAAAGVSIIAVSLPVAANAQVQVFMPLGTALVFDTSAGLRYPGLVHLSSLSAICFAATRTTANSFLGADDFVAALATGDIIAWSLAYEAA